MTTEPRDPRVRRLVFELVEAAPEAPPFPARGVASTERAMPRVPRPRALIVALLAALLVVGAVNAVIVARRTPAHKGPVAGPGGAPAVAYVDSRGLVVRSPSGGETVVATGAVSAPRWSPSGDWLAYRSGNSVWAVRSDASDRRRVSDLTGAYYFDDAFAWSPATDALAVLDGAGVRVWWFARASADAVVITPTVGPVSSSVQSFAWSRGGTSLAMAVERREHAGPGAPVDSLWLAQGVCRPVAPAECSQPRDLRRILYTPGTDDYPLGVVGFGFGNTQLLFWADSVGSSSIKMDGLPLKAVSIDGGPAATIATTIVRDSWVQPSPDGSQLLVVRSTGRMVTDPREINVCNSSHACRAIAPAADVQTLDPAWSPDGHRIAFVREDASFTPPVSNGTIDWRVKYQHRTLWIANADGTDAHEITAAGRGVADPQFAPDGDAIVFVRNARVWQLDLTTGRLVALSDSLRVSPCTSQSKECLPDVEVYEGLDLWSDHYAVKFAAIPR